MRWAATFIGLLMAAWLFISCLAVAELVRFITERCECGKHLVDRGNSYDDKKGTRHSRRKCHPYREMIP